MDNTVIQLLLLAGIAVFLILRLRSVLGTREGYERPPEPLPRGDDRAGGRPALDVIEGGVDHDIADHAPAGSSAAQALAAMKRVEPDFHVGDFLSGARQAYEMILMGFENGDMDNLVPFLSRDVFESFDEVVQLRDREGLRVEANFVGVREVDLEDATYDEATGTAEITVRFLGELTSVVLNREGEVVEGDRDKVKQQRDVWTFGRVMGSDNPNWKLVGTGE